MAVDEYAVGVIAFYLFSGMKDCNPYKIPRSLEDDDQIFDHLERSVLDFSQPIWQCYKFAE